MALDWLLVVATIFDSFQLLGAFCLQQISQVEILLGDQVQDMLARTLGDSTAAADPWNSTIK
jgi:hypothetical protein